MPRRNRRTGLPHEVAFPVTPFLDMAFQMLAFFILTFRPPSRETRLDLDLPATPATLPKAETGRTLASPFNDPDLETDLIIRAEADERGTLISLRLGETVLRDTDDLGTRVRQYADLLAGRPLAIRFAAPDRLRFSEASRIIGACEAAGVASVRLIEGEGTGP